MKVTIDIPDRDYGQMVVRAEEHGLKVPELIRMAIYEAMPKRRPFGEDVLQLVRVGYPDALIAERFGVTNATIANIRRKAKLPANRFTRTDNPQPPASSGVSFSNEEAA